MSVRPPEACTCMAEVRAGVDDLDRRLVALIAERFAYMEAAARLKPGRAEVRDEARKAQVIAHVRREAEMHGLDPALTTALWETLVEASIAYEFDEWDRQRAPTRATAHGA
jgi:isochorismate pyruvate lyase